MPPRPSAPSAPKTIIPAFDGTLNKFTRHKTNVLRLFGLLDKADDDKQVLYYQPGVGTYLAEGNAWSPTIKAIKETLDGVFAWYLDIHILGGYRFLMKHYKPGDRVCMFGFSRGAYTARCLAGMLNKVGLLLQDNDEMVASAYELYLNTSPDGKTLARDFKERLCRHCPIEFLGLWRGKDTVSSVGLVTSRHLPCSASNSAVKTVRHALALDERRTKFRHNLWYGNAREESEKPPSFLQGLASVLVEPSQMLSFLWPPPPTPENAHAVDENATRRTTDVKEVWFAGCHSDVGGGHGDPNTLNTISDPSLCWMINQIFLSGAPVRFDIKVLNKGFKYTAANPLPIPPENDDPNGSTRTWNPNLPKVAQWAVSTNPTSRIHDELKSNWFWWIPEFLPFRSSIYDRRGDAWKEIRLPNLGAGRKIWEGEILIHESVKLRMENGSYQPMATFGRNTPNVQLLPYTPPPTDGLQRGRQSREQASMSQRQSLGNSKRPLSAIFIGDLSNSSDSHSQSQLPSPPSTQGSGDGSLRGKPRQQMHDERPESRASQSRRRDSSDEDDDPRHRDDEDNTARLSDPRFSLTSSGSRAGSRAGFRRGDDDAVGTDGALHRAENLYARNRQVLDRISAITSHSRLNSPSPRPMPSKSPIPRPPSSAQAQRNNRLRHSISGSETERDQRRDSMSDEHSTPPQSAGIQSRFDDGGYPPADEDYEAEAERGGPSRTLRRSLNGTASRRRGLDPDSPLFSGAIHAAINDPPTSVRTSPHRTRNPLPQEFRDRPGYNGYDREPSPETSYRNPSRERTADYSPPSPTRNRVDSRTDYNARPPSVLGNGRMTGRPSSRASNYLGPSTSTAMTPSNSGMTTSSSNRSNVGRFATVRERGSHYRWASEDVHSPDDYPGDRSRGDVSLNEARGDGEHPPRWRYQSRGGSAESALGHRLVGEGLRQAGLTKRRESSPPRRGEDLFSGDRSGREDKGKDREPFPKIESSGSSSAVSVITTRSQESEMRRDRLSRLPGMERVVSADPRTPYNRENSRGPPVTASRTGSSGGPARPATSIDPQFYENGPRTAPPPLRSYRSYAVTDRDRVPPSASRTSYASPVALRPYDEERDEKLSIPPKPGSALRRLNTASPAPDHARLLQEAFRAFEGNVRRAGPSIHPNAASGCVNAADTLVKAASILNSLLRSNADRAMEELVEAEVDDEGRASAGEAEVWRRVGAEFRESAKVSDEIIRTMTAFLLDVGRVMRDAASVTASSSGRGTPPASTSSAVFPPPPLALHHAGSNGHLRTMSLDEEALAMRRAESNSNDGRSSLAGSGSGFSAGARARQSVDGGSVSSSSRRSIDRGGRSGSGRLSSEFGEIGSRDSRRSLDGRDSGSLRRLATRRTPSGQFDQARPPPSAFDHQRLSTFDQQRASTSMSMSRSAGTQSSDRERDRREYDSPVARDVPDDDVPDPTPSKPAKSSVLQSLASRRLFPSRRPQTSPANAKPPPLVRTSTDVDSPTTQGRNGVSPGISPRVGDEDRRRRFPSLAIPPPLSTLPSESHMERRLTPRSASGQGADLSRKKTSTGSTATVTLRAGGARFPSLTSPSKPTTQVTPTTVSTASDREYDSRPVNRSSQQQAPDRAYHHDGLGTRASNAATISVAASRQFSGEREQRQRTLSTLSASDAGIREDSGEYEELLAGSTTSTIVGRRNQETRPDSGHYATTRGSDRDRHNRRRTVGEIFR